MGSFLLFCVFDYVGYAVEEMTVKLYPPLRQQFDMARREQVYKTRLLELFNGSVKEAREAHDAWVLHRPPIHHWVTWNTIAMMESVCDMLPSERQQMVAEVKFTPSKP